MGIFFESYRDICCCLCGSTDNLTGEHKVKAAALRSIFGRTPMVIGDFSENGYMRSAQGPKSKAFHFNSRICEVCNSARTQMPDREFDLFHVAVSKCIEKGEEPNAVFALPRYSINSEPYINVSRYFAKLICCQIAESSGPRPNFISEFCIGRSNKNPILLRIDYDPTYIDYLSTYNIEKYAAHGGLVAIINSTTVWPTGFYSTLTLKSIRYSFMARFGPIAGLSLKIFHPAFWERCYAAYIDGRENPLREAERIRLGL